MGLLTPDSLPLLNVQQLTDEQTALAFEKHKLFYLDKKVLHDISYN